jgi:hypothetical protein
MNEVSMRSQPKKFFSSQVKNYSRVADSPSVEREDFRLKEVRSWPTMQLRNLFLDLKSIWKNSEKCDFSGSSFECAIMRQGCAHAWANKSCLTAMPFHGGLWMRSVRKRSVAAGTELPPDLSDRSTNDLGAGRSYHISFGV